MNKQTILEAFRALNDELTTKGVKGELCLYGGAAMCLAFEARESTKDVDAIFHPAAELRAAAISVANRLGLPEDWINDGVKGFLAEHGKKIWMQLSNLAIYVAEADYLLAMKAMAARVDTSDRDDIQLLLKELGIGSLQGALQIVERYYPAQRIKPATLYFLEELFDASPEN